MMRKLEELMPKELALFVYSVTSSVALFEHVYGELHTSYYDGSWHYDLEMEIKHAPRTELGSTILVHVDATQDVDEDIEGAEEKSLEIRIELDGGIMLVKEERHLPEGKVIISTAEVKI